MTLQWKTPVSSILGTVLEYQLGDPVFSTLLEVDTEPTTSPTIFYEVISGDAPQYYQIVPQAANTALFQIKPFVRELDEYIDGYQKPEGFTYDSDDTAGGNYATYGSALSGGFNCVFTIRAWVVTGETPYIDSNGNTVYDTDSNMQYVDKEFSLFVTNNWSSDGRTFIREYYDGQTLINGDGDENTVEEYLQWLTDLGILL